MIFLGLAVIGIIIGIASLFLQYTAQQPDQYEQMIEESCKGRGYEHSSFTDDLATVPGQPLCCRMNYCVSYEVAMQYGPGYEPVGGGST